MHNLYFRHIKDHITPERKSGKVRSRIWPSLYDPLPCVFQIFYKLYTKVKLYMYGFLSVVSFSRIRNFKNENSQTRQLCLNQSWCPYMEHANQILSQYNNKETQILLFNDCLIRKYQIKNKLKKVLTNVTLENVVKIKVREIQMSETIQYSRFMMYMLLFLIICSNKNT